MKLQKRANNAKKKFQKILPLKNDTGPAKTSLRTNYRKDFNPKKSDQDHN